MYAQFKKQQCVMDFTVKRQVVRPHSGCGPDCRPTDIAQSLEVGVLQAKCLCSEITAHSYSLAIACA